MDMKNFTFGPQYDIQSTFEKSTDLVIESEIKAGVTALEWVELDERGVGVFCFCEFLDSELMSVF